MIDPWIYVALAATAVLTGFVDAIAGGGGLIMMPALLFAGVAPIEALGTNKLQSMLGTATAFRNFAGKRLDALTKFSNLTSNVASVIFFALGGKILWLLGLSMAEARCLAAGLAAIPRCASGPRSSGRCL